MTLPRGDARRRDTCIFQTACVATDPNKGTVVGVGDFDPHGVLCLETDIRDTALIARSSEVSSGNRVSSVVSESCRALRRWVTTRTVPQPDNVYQWVVLGSAANLAQRFRNFDDNAAK